jgi:FkbH-like protein
VFTGEPDITICLLDAGEVAARLPVPWTPADAEHALRDLSSSLRQLAEEFQRSHASTLVLNTIPLPRSLAAQLVDYHSRSVLGAVWREFNAHLLRFGTERPGIAVVDTETLLCPSGQLADPRIASHAKVQFSDAFFAGYAREIGHLARALSGRTSKCLVLDLDGTLWGGILAEDGPAGIEVSDGVRGEAFHAFQSAVKQLGAQGALVAVCSKNDEALAREVLTANENLALRVDDLVAVVANWGAKPDNLTQLAEQLGIGVDSLVFVDDSPTERGMVRAALPAVPVIDVDSDEPAMHTHQLLADGWFVTLEVTAEDRDRAERYRTERTRLEFRERSDSLAGYLAGLGTTVELSHATADDAARLAQITQRTNQFNLTTVRLDTAGVRRMVDDGGVEVFAIRCADRFGQHGTVGAVFATWWGQAMHLDNFLLSCRVLARDVESACLRAILSYAKQAGAAEVVASFRPTAKNQRTRDFYPSHGFVPMDGPGDAAVRFHHDLNGLPPPVPHVAMTVRLSDPEQEGVAE